jgi:predicted PurR-regulated permease PerM
MTPQPFARPTPAQPARQPYALLRIATLALATLAGVYVCYLLSVPFIPALVWALAATVLAMPLHRRLEARLKKPGLAAGISLLLIMLLVVLPLAFLATALIGAAGSGITSVQEQVGGGDLQRLVQSHWLTRRLIAVAPADLDLTSILASITGWIAGLGGALLQGSVTNVVTILLAFYVMFFFLRDHDEALNQVRLLSPLSRTETDFLFIRVSDTIHAVLVGNLITSAIQGTLGGLMFWVLGLPNPVFWGTVMAFVAMIPVLGTFVIWLPAAAYLALSGDWGKAAILAGWGAVVIGGIDNFLYPILAGGRLRLHTIPLFIAIVGGLALFGTSGLILGPLAVVLTLALLKIWRDRAEAAPLTKAPAHETTVRA